MVKAKAFIYRVLFFFTGIKDQISTSLFLQINRKARSVYFVDIDNTIGDTWPSFLQKWPSEANRLTNIRPFEGMKRYLHQIGEDKDNVIIYITARNIRYGSLTKKWLKHHGFPLSNSKLVLVASPGQKIRYLKLPGSQFTVTYIDDLAYGHETGEVKKYASIIEAVKKLPLTYIGSEEINIINAL